MLSTTSTHKVCKWNICGKYCWQIRFVWQNEYIFVVLVAISCWSGIDGTGHNDADQFTRILKSPTLVSLRNLDSSRVEGRRHITQWRSYGWAGQLLRDGLFGKLRITSLYHGRVEKYWRSHEGYHGRIETKLVYAQTNGCLSSYLVLSFPKTRLAFSVSWNSSTAGVVLTRY